MPLGLARSILSKTAPAAAGMTDRGYWVSTGTVATGSNAANIVADRGSNWSWGGESTFMIWFKGTTAGQDAQASFAHLRLNNQFPIILNVEKGAGNNITGFAKNLTDPKSIAFATAVASFDANYLDNQWHQLVISAKINATTYQCQIYLDGTQIKNTSLSGKTAATAGDSSRYMYFGAGADNFPAGGYENDPDGAHLHQIGMIFYDNSFIDLTTNIDKFYDGGGVDLGTDGTASGLAQPDVYLLPDAAGNMIGGSGTLQNGGSVSFSSINAVREGTGNIEVFTSGGPS